MRLLRLSQSASSLIDEPTGSPPAGVKLKVQPEMHSGGFFKAACFLGLKSL